MENPRVEILRIALCHADERRVISELILQNPLPTMQIKTVAMIDLDKTVGNHSHTTESGRIELFMVFADNQNDQFMFRYRQGANQPVKKAVLVNGDVVIVNPGASHAFKALRPGAILVCLSNQDRYDEKNDRKDELF